MKANENNTASFKKVGSLASENLKNAVEINGIKLLKKTDIGFEIVDGRTLKQRFEKPIKGKKNIIYCFGATHYVVTEKYYNELTKCE